MKSPSAPKTDIVGDLIGLIGKDETFRLIEAFSGDRLYIPQNPSGSPKLLAVITTNSIRLLSSQYGGLSLKVPLAKVWRTQVYREAGLSYQAIARRLGCSTVTVHSYLGQLGMIAREKVLQGTEKAPI